MGEPDVAVPAGHTAGALAPAAGSGPPEWRATVHAHAAGAASAWLAVRSILHEIEAMTSNILLINNGRILAEGNVHQIRDLIDEHPHTVYIRAEDPRGLARGFLTHADVISMRFEPGAVVVETGKPDEFYARLTELVAAGDSGAV